MNIGILFALGASFAWGIGDFLLQRSSRKLGDWATLFFVEIFAVAGLLPFVYGRLASLDSADWTLLFMVCFANFVAAFLDVEALREGKISVVEPVLALEVGVTASLAFAFLGEALTSAQGIMLVGLVAGVVLVSTRSFSHFRHPSWERGVLVAIACTLVMGLNNFLYGVSSRQIDPILVNWMTSSFILAASVIYLALRSSIRDLWRDWRENKKLLFTMSVIDNSAWISFSYAMVFIPISVATAISESYIAFAAVLGVLFNQERLRPHQWLGFSLAMGSAILLSFTTP